MISLKRIIIGVVWLVAIFLIGSFGYVILEGWSFFEGFYMTVITLTTVGYGEVRPLTQTGRTFTIMLIFLGVGFMFYVVTAIAQVVVEGQLRDVFGRRRLEREIRNLKDHYIICGFGRIGEVIARELSHNHIPIVVVDNRPQHTSEPGAVRIPARHRQRHPGRGAVGRGHRAGPGTYLGGRL